MVMGARLHKLPHHMSPCVAPLCTCTYKYAKYRATFISSIIFSSRRTQCVWAYFLWIMISNIRNKKKTYNSKDKSKTVLMEFASLGHAVETPTYVHSLPSVNEFLQHLRCGSERDPKLQFFSISIFFCRNNKGLSQ